MPVPNPFSMANQQGSRLLRLPVGLRLTIYSYLLPQELSRPADQEQKVRSLKYETDWDYNYHTQCWARLAACRAVRPLPYFDYAQDHLPLVSGLLSCCDLTFDEFTAFLLKDIVKRIRTLKAYMDECQLELKYSKSRPEHAQYSCVAGQWAFRFIDCKKEI